MDLGEKLLEVARDGQIKNELIKLISQGAPFITDRVCLCIKKLNSKFN